MIRPGALQLGAGRGAQADRALREHGHCVADLHVAGLRGRKAGGGDIGQQDHLLVDQFVGNFGEVGLRVGDQHVFGLRAVNGVAEFPAADGAAALRPVSAQAKVALAARSNGADQDAIAYFVAGDAGTDLMDHADRFVADHQARLTGYSPFTMWTSVPQIVVSVTRITTSPARALGTGTVSRLICPGP